MEELENPFKIKSQRFKLLLKRQPGEIFFYQGINQNQIQKAITIFSLNSENSACNYNSEIDVCYLSHRDNF